VFLVTLLNLPVATTTVVVLWSAYDVSFCVIAFQVLVVQDYSSTRRIAGLQDCRIADSPIHMFFKSGFSGFMLELFRVVVDQ
jgi:hypothetical protein